MFRATMFVPRCLFHDVSFHDVSFHDVSIVLTPLFQLPRSTYGQGAVLDGRLGRLDFELGTCGGN